MNIICLKEIVKSGPKYYPIYIGFIEAKEILSVSKVPNFSENDHDKDLAKNLLKRPVEKWQRPLIKKKRENITNTFNDSGEFMPNPVLLSENPNARNVNIEATPLVIKGQATDFWDVKIPDNKNALWIIDGQHRITGLGHDDCKQNQNKIPVVLLLNGDDNFYTPIDFAKIFAQVTTKATSLNDLHKEWMQYSFDMDKYSNVMNSKAMRSVVELCSAPDFKDSGDCRRDF